MSFLDRALAVPRQNKNKSECPEPAPPRVRAGSLRCRFVIHATPRGRNTRAWLDGWHFQRCSWDSWGSRWLLRAGFRSRRLRVAFALAIALRAALAALVRALAAQVPLPPAPSARQSVTATVSGEGPSCDSQAIRIVRVALPTHVQLGRTSVFKEPAAGSATSCPVPHRQ